MCAAFRRCGADVTLVHPFRIGNRPEGYDGDVWRFYGTRDRFAIVTLPTPLTRRLSGIRLIGRPLQALPLALYLVWRCRPRQPDFAVYARSFLGAWLALRIRRIWAGRSACRGIFVEVHDEPRRSRDWDVLAGADGVVAITNALRKRLIDRQPEVGSRVWVEHDGADVDSINAVPVDRAAAREQLRLPPTAFIAVYTGRVNEEKGADVVLAAAESLGEFGVGIVLVGRVYGEALARRAAALENVTLTGFVPPAQVPLFLRAADILLLPGTPRLPYADYTSPLKMFEYMAAGRPVVASDLPVFGEVLVDGQNALTYPASRPDALAKAVRRLQSDPSLAASLADRAMRDVQGFAWNRRAERILSRLDAAGG